MKQLIKKIIFRLIPKKIKYLIYNQISRAVNPNLEKIYQQLANFEKVEHKLNMLEMHMEKQIQRLASIEKFENKMRSFDESNLIKFNNNQSKNKNIEIEENVFSDSEYNRLERNICRGRKKIEEYYFDSLCENFSPSSKILDLGCGEGSFIKRMNDKGFNAQGIDSNEECAKELNVILGCVPEALMEFESNSYDIITSFHLIEHMPLDKYKKMILEIKRLLKKNGKIIFETPNTQSLITMSQYYYKDPTHLMPRHPEIYLNILDFNGFKNCEVKNLPELDDNSFEKIMDIDGKLGENNTEIINDKFSKIENMLVSGSGNILITAEK